VELAILRDDFESILDCCHWRYVIHKWHSSSMQLLIELFMPRFLMNQLGLSPLVDNISNQTMSNRTLYLHDVENALGSLLALVFWIGKGCTLFQGHADFLSAGHIHPSQLRINFEANSAWEGVGETDVITKFEPADAPTLKTGSAMMNQVHTAARLDVS
jgi:hypothetical protein